MNTKHNIFIHIFQVPIIYHVIDDYSCKEPRKSGFSINAIKLSTKSSCAESAYANTQTTNESTVWIPDHCRTIGGRHHFLSQQQSLTTRCNGTGRLPHWRWWEPNQTTTVWRGLCASRHQTTTVWKGLCAPIIHHFHDELYYSQIPRRTLSFNTAERNLILQYYPNELCKSTLPWWPLYFNTTEMNSVIQHYRNEPYRSTLPL